MLVAVTPEKTGEIDIDGRVTANGFRGCASGNDSAGGGAGGTVVILGEHVDISATGRICPICAGEAGGGVGDLELDADYLGEVCDGFDNDFNGVVDDGVEICDDLDDDCDDVADEGFEDKGLACDNGLLGVCHRAGTIQCTDDGSATACAFDGPEVQPSDELCDGLDNDCDGETDEQAELVANDPGTFQAPAQSGADGCACRSDSAARSPSQWLSLGLLGLLSLGSIGRCLSPWTTLAVIGNISGPLSSAS